MTTVMEINREHWPHYFSEEENDEKENYEKENYESGKSEYEMVDEEKEATAIARADLMMLNLNKHGLVEGVDPDDEDALRGVVPEVFTCVTNDEVHFDERNIDPFDEEYGAMLKPMIKDNQADKRYISPIDVCKRKCEGSCDCPIVKSGVIINGTWYAEDYRNFYYAEKVQFMKGILDEIIDIATCKPIVTPNVLPFIDRIPLGPDDDKIVDDVVEEYMDNMNFSGNDDGDDEFSDDESELDEEDAKELLRLIVTSPEKIVDEAVIAQMKEFEDEEVVVPTIDPNLVPTIDPATDPDSDTGSIQYFSDDVYEGDNPEVQAIVRCANCRSKKKYCNMLHTCDEPDTNEFYVCDEHCLKAWKKENEQQKLRQWRADATNYAKTLTTTTTTTTTNVENDYNMDEDNNDHDNEIVEREQNDSLDVIASVAVETASRGRGRPKGVAGRRKTKAYERRNPNGLDFLTNCISQVPTRKRKRGKRMQNVNSEIRNMDEEITPDRLKEIFRHGFCPYEGCNYHEDRRSQRWYRKKGAEQHLIDIHNCTVLDEDGVAKNIYPFKCNHPKCQTLILAKKGMHSFGEYKEHMQRHCRTVTKVDGGGALALCGKVTYPFEYNNCPLDCACWTQRLGDGCKDGCKKCIKRRRVDALKI